MRSPCLLVTLLLAACGTDVRPTQGSQDSDSDPGVDGGIEIDGGSSSTDSDAGVPPPTGDGGIPAGLAPCDEAPYHSDFAFIQEKVFDVSCAVSGCHSVEKKAGGLDLSAGNAHASLVNVPSHHFDGWTRVVPSSSAQSMLMVQVGGEPGPQLEGFMPWGDPKLCDPLIDAMRRWINAGALNN